MPKIINFSENLEKDLERIGQHVREQMQHAQSEILPHQEIVKQSILSLSKEIQNESSSSVSQKEESQEDLYLPSYFSDTDEAADEAKKAVEYLVDVALHSDIEKAIKLSKKYPAFIEDAFHDALVDKLIPELKKKGILT